MIIKSILDSDQYKFNMQNAVIQLFPRALVKYEFINRGKTEFPDGFDLRLRREISNMSNLVLTHEEKIWMTKHCGEYLPPTYMDFLNGYRFDSTEVGVTQNGGDLKITIQGFWYRTILWEVPLMAIISELYFEMTGQKGDDRETRRKKNIEKAKLFHFHSVQVADFGTRRRFSHDNQGYVIEDMLSFIGAKTNFIGTSNPFFAMKYGIKSIGTQAHEWISFMAAKYGFRMANEKALEHWVEVYQGSLGIALTDTFTTDDFLRVFSKKYAKLFDGDRQDSADPFIYADKLISHYKKLGIDPMDKTIVFSNALTSELAVEIDNYCRGKIKSSFGIGTHFSNDCGVKPLNIVIKMIAAKPFDSIEWIDTVKLSDEEGKHTGSAKAIKLAYDTLGIQPKQELITA